MDYYKKEIKETLETIIADGYETKEQILNRWEGGDTQDDFGNLTGSRFCSRYMAEQALKEAGFPWNDELNNMLEEYDYNIVKLLEKGPEVTDVVLCELTLLCTDIINEIKEGN